MKIQLNCESLKAVYLSERLYKIGLLLAYIRFYTDHGIRNTEVLLLFLKESFIFSLNTKKTTRLYIYVYI